MPQFWRSIGIHLPFPIAFFFVPSLPEQTGQQASQYQPYACVGMCCTAGRFPDMSQLTRIVREYANRRQGHYSPFGSFDTLGLSSWPWLPTSLHFLQVTRSMFMS